MNIRSIALPLIMSLSSVLSLSACRTVTKPVDSDIKASWREPSIPDAELTGVSFDFCPQKHSFSLVNALWLTYLASAQYSHFKVVGPELEAFGFGDPGEGRAFLKAWYVIRIKRIQEKRPDTDDNWKNENERLVRLEFVRREYKDLYKSDYVDDGSSAAAYEKTIVGGRAKGKIQFFTGIYQSSESSFTKGSSQVFYAEHPTRDFSVISIRGSEFDERDDLTTDANLLYEDFPGLGKVHSGFLQAYNEVEEQILTLLLERSSQKPINLWITGHSLGAGVSTLLTARIMLMHERGALRNVKLMGSYNLGSPRIGNLAFAQGFDRMALAHNVTFVRIKNHADSITQIPPAGYWHVGALAYVGGDGRLYYGEGWKSIEKDSDYLKNYSTSTADHRVLPYWTAMKRAYLRDKDLPVGNCSLETGNLAPQPFYENAADRKP